MTHFSESRRGLLLGTAGFALVGCGEGVKKPNQPAKFQAVTPFTPLHEPTIPNVLLTPTEILTPFAEVKPKSKEYYSPKNVWLPRIGIGLNIEEGEMTFDNQLIIKDGEYIQDFSRGLVVGDNSLLLTGHSRWNKIKSLMGLTIDLNMQDTFVVGDEKKGPIPFAVNKLEIQNWYGVQQIYKQDRGVGTAIMFTSLRGDKAKYKKEHYFPKESVIDRVDNPTQAEALYGGDDYLYWVVTSTERPFVHPPEIF